MRELINLKTQLNTWRESNTAQLTVVDPRAIHTIAKIQGAIEVIDSAIEIINEKLEKEGDIEEWTLDEE